jgi:hypothetical protein
LVDLSYQAQVQPEGLPGRAFPRLPEEVPQGAFGGEIGRGVENAGEVAQQHFEQVQNIARQTQLTDAHNQLQTLSLGLTHDPQTGALTKQGKDAFGLPQQYLPQYDEQAAKIVAAVPDPRARQAAQLAAAQVRGHLAEQLDTHELEQHRQFGIQTAQSSIALAQQAAGMNANHPDLIAAQRDHIEASVDSLAQQQGWGPEQTQEAKLKAINGLHESVVRGLVSTGHSDLAQTYVNANIGEMDPQASESAQRLIYATEEHNLVMQEKRQKIASDNLSKQGDSLLARGQLTPAWIEAHRNALEPNEFRYFYKALSGTEESATDPKTFADLYLKAANGEDVRDEARSALIDSHSLSRQDFTKITGLVDQERPGWFKRGTQFLSSSLDPGQLNPDPAAHQSRAFALEDWQEWAGKNPNATDDQARKQQEEIAAHYRIVPEGKTTLLMKAPAHLVGTRSNPVDEQGKPDPMLNATVRRMRAALDAGEITADDAQQEAKLIQQYRLINQAQIQKKQQQGAKP